MPMYDYACPTCGEQITKLYRTFSAVPSKPPDCPKCKTAMAKRLGGTSFALKGTGWAKDGYGG